MNNITEKLEKGLKNNNIYEKEPMHQHTSFKIGGIADYFVKVESEEELKFVLDMVEKEKIPFFILGNGTNLLVREGGFRGVVIKLEMKNYTIGKHENFAYITVESGMTLAYLAQIALENGLTGLEAMSGIPGTVGGAIKMNAGAYGREMKDVVVFSKGMNLKGESKELNWQEHHFEYRKSAFENNGLILLETTLKLEYGKKDEIQEKMMEYKTLRIKNQPLEFPNAGSTFKRTGNIPTAKMIEECGLKGCRVGDAEVSTKHAGFIINKGKATATDVLELVEKIKKAVKQEFEKDIELEMIVIGEK